MALGDGLYLHRSGVYYTSFRVGSRQYRRSTGESNRRKARKAARQIRAEVEAQAPKTQAKKKQSKRLPRTLESLQLLDIADHENRGVTALHINRLESKWNVILERIDGDTHPADITHEFLRDYEGKRRKEGIRGQTIVREFQAIKRALLIARRKRWLAELPDPWPSVRRDDKDKKRAGKLRPPELLARFIQCLNEDARDEVEVALLTGLRIAELKRIEPDWVEPFKKGAILRIPPWGSKTRNERVVGLPKTAFAIMKRRIKAMGKDEEKVFSQSDFKRHRAEVSQLVQGSKADGDPYGTGSAPNITMRDLRHTYATLALQGSNDPVATMRALGHKDLRTTEMYLSSSVERIAMLGDTVAGILDAPKKPEV